MTFGTNNNEGNELEYRQTKIVEFRNKIKDDGLVNTRTDDEFLNRFLRAKEYRVNSALYMLQSYLQYNEKYTDAWQTIERPMITKVLESAVADILPGSDSKGRRVFWLRIGKWKPSDLSLDVGLQVAALVTQAAIIAESSTTPFTSLVGIFDLKDTGLSQLTATSPAFAKRMISFLSACLPMHIDEIHVVRESSVFSLLFAIFKSFLTEHMKEKIKTHGSNFESLHKHVDKTLLPSDLGGTAIKVKATRWTSILESEKIVTELDKTGFHIV